MPRQFTPNKYRIVGDTIRILVIRTNGKRYVVLIDKEDVGILNNWRICVDEDKYGKLSVRGYGALFEGKRPKVLLSRLVINADNSLLVDHKDHNSLNNKKSNLRQVTTAQNAQNRKGATSLSKSGIRGVWWCEEKQKWIASIRKNGKHIYTGWFDDIETAEKTVVEKRAQLHPFSENDARGVCYV